MKHNWIFLLIILISLFYFAGCEDHNTGPNYQNSIMPVSTYLTAGECLDSYIKNLSGTDYSFLALYSSGMQIVNVSNPSSPQPVSTYNISGHAEETFAVKFDSIPYAFIASGEGGLYVLNLSNITAPVIDTEISFGGDYIASVFIDTVRKALFTGGSGRTMYILNVSSLPVVSRFSAFDTYSNINEIQVRNNIAYIAQDTGLDIVDVSNLQSPVSIAAGSTGDFFYDVKLTGNLAVIANNENGVLLLNVSTPGNPSQVGFLNTTGIGLACTVNGNLVYVAEDQTGVEVFDISDPYNPRYLNAYSTKSYSVNLTYYNNYTFVSDYNAYVVLRYP